MAEAEPEQEVAAATSAAGSRVGSGKSQTMGMSASAPVLQNSPYAATVGKPMRRPKVWVPPPGQFNEPDLPRFTNPGPGRYNPAHQHTCLSTKPRITATRFGSEDRFKYLGPQTALEPMQSGMVGGLFCPQSSSSPGPGYLPSYDLVKPMARKSSFTVAVPLREGRGSSPGPGLYNPTDKSTRRNYTSGGGFLADDRHKYLGEVDPASLQPLKKCSPGPMYKPGRYCQGKRVTTVAFGGHGPGTIIKPPSLKSESPGPGAYTPGFSDLPRSQISSFSVESRTAKGQVDSSACYQGKVKVDMTHASATNLSPGPGYNPSHRSVLPSSSQPIIGTSKRFNSASTL